VRSAADRPKGAGRVLIAGGELGRERRALADEPLLVGCLARERQGCDPEARQRMIDVVCTGLRAEPGTPVGDDRELAG
jgi:hypothetical protein